MKVNFSIIGSALNVKVYYPDTELYQKAILFTERELFDILYNFESFSKLKYTDNSVNSIFDVIPSEQFLLYEIDQRTRLEIKKDNTERVKIFFKNIFAEDLLFPAYDFSYSLSNSFPEGLVVIENDMGSFGKSTHNLIDFNMHDIRFEAFTAKELAQKYIKAIYLNDNELVFRKKDSLFLNCKNIIKT